MQEIAIMYSAGQYDRILEQYLKESQLINHGCDEKNAEEMKNSFTIFSEHARQKDSILIAWMC